MPLRAPSLLFVLAFPAAIQAQSLDLMVNNTGLSIGDSRFVRGVRVNFRDRNLERVVEGGILAPFYFKIESEKNGELGRVKGVGTARSADRSAELRGQQQERPAAVADLQQRMVRA